jgi:hypothetical protein
LLGLAAFWLVVGAGPLSPTNIAWFQGDDADPAQHYLGWAFFRASRWTLPIGANPDYGLEQSSGIVFSDSIPLLAFVFKLFSSLLPTPFQYFGLWLLLCYVLQAVFAARLAALVIAPRPARLAFAALLLFTPALMQRLNGHYTLCGHWLVLAGLYLCARRDSDPAPSAAWIGLALLACLIHPYLLVMVLALWVASLTMRARTGSLPARSAVIEVAVVLGLVALGAWQSGWFLPGTSVSGWGFGYYRMNLLSPIDPNGWSYLLPDLPQESGDYEGFNYFGLGALLVVALALSTLRRSRPPLELLLPWTPLALVLVALALFAVSNKIGVADHEVAIPLPALVLRAANVFRSSGRMFWPVGYSLVLGALWLVTRTHGPRVATWVLLGAAAIQIIDTSASWRPLSQKLFQQSGSVWSTPLRSPFWEEAAPRYAALRVVTAEARGHACAPFSYLALTHGLATDCADLARPDAERERQIAEQSFQALLQGPDADALYVLDEDQARRLAPEKRASDWLGPVDGWFVLAPKGASRERP